MKFALLLGLVFASMLSYSNSARACICGGLTEEQEFALSPSIFLGEVIYISNSPENQRGRGRRLVILKVEEFIKRSSPENAAYRVIATSAQDAGCGYKFETGGRYKIWSNVSENELVEDVSLCSRTERLDQ